MFPLVLFSALFSSIFTEPREKRWVCNSSDATVWYDYCDNLKFPISIHSEPCITLKGSRGILYLYYIPRRDIKSLYFNIYLSTKSMNFPLRKEVICRGYDDDFSFCRALKGVARLLSIVCICFGTSCQHRLPGLLCCLLTDHPIPGQVPQHG
ncbi:lymphocyte antigen 96 isoform X2 [Moschus berezovskii]|uniref:lymphocyte antigen 96 isoform X2 n=1 Tax=Moschus berezovskii TaxID=68408 RepID=UPI0024452228|nr:lymphocyte antigen 96 isoform X2 [Moschus berezovskii]